MTGARGLLGSALVTTLSDSGQVVRALVSDITDQDAVDREVSAFSPTHVVHAAAIANVAECERDPVRAERVHVAGTAYVRDAAAKVGARFIYISTASVFSGHEGNYREDDTPEPRGVYNETKYRGERETLSYERGSVVRLTVVGIHPAGSRGKNLLEWLHDSFAANKDLTLFTDQYINPLSHWTIARLLNALCERGIEERVLHIGSSDHRSKADIGLLVKSHFPDYRGTITTASIDSLSDGAIRPKEMWLNTDLAHRLFGPMPALQEEIDLVFSKQPF